MPPIRFIINGRLHTVSDVPPTTTLLQYLRLSPGLTGTKEGCAEGDCGACTVAVRDGDRWRAVNACLIPLPALQGLTLVTVEGLAEGERLHPAQEALVAHSGSQCGYCTPGFVMSLFEACYRDDLDERWRRDDQICGNLCRCTGYRPIRDALDAVAGSRPDDRFSAQLGAPDASREVTYTHGAHAFLQPTTLPALFSAMQEHPEHAIISGATDLGLEITKRGRVWPCLISLSALPLSGYTASADTITIGATLSLADLERLCAADLPPLARMLRFFASRQIKHRATAGGNLCTASPIGDLAPVLIALSAEVVLLSASGERRMPLQDFFTGYRKTALRSGEILASIAVPRIQAGQRVSAYKVSKRRELDISSVSAGMMVRLDESGCVADIRLVYGGMAATTQRAISAEAALLGQPWTAERIEAAAAKIAEDFTPLSDHRGSAWYRATVAANLLRGFFAETADSPLPMLPTHPSGTVLGGER